MDKSNGKSPITYTLEEIDRPYHLPSDRPSGQDNNEEDFLADYLAMGPLTLENMELQDGSNQMENLTRDLEEEKDVESPKEDVGVAAEIPTEAEDGSNQMENLTRVVEEEKDVESPKEDGGVAGEVPTEEEASRALVVWRNQEEHANRIVSAHPQHERLRGWRIQERPRQSTSRIDKFYIHMISDIQFRSLNEVDDFVHLGLHPKRLTKGQAAGGARGEGTSEKRSTRRTLSWEFELKGILNDGVSEVYDIRFLQRRPNSSPYPNLAESSRARRHGSPSSEETLSDHGRCGHEHRQQRVGRRNRPMTMKEEVETFLRESYENLMNWGTVDSDQTEEEIHGETSQNVFTSSTANTSTRDKGKRKKEDDEENGGKGSKSKTPRI